jgi:hypothetical protein
VKHPTTLALAVVPVCIGLALSAGPTFAGTTAAKSTSFAFKTSGFGTRVVGGQAPTRSDTSAYQVIGCTNRSGKHKENDVGRATVPGLGRVSDSRTRVWTTAKHGVVASHSTHSISKIVLASSGLGSLRIDGITSTATASHDSDGFHSVTSTRIGSLTFTPPVGPAHTFPAPTPDQPIAIPGLATIYAGQHVTRHSGTGAVANAFALRVDVVPTGTSVQVARSHAELDSGLTGGVFGGHSAATHVVSVGGGIARGGPDPLTVMPCQGTYGKVHEKTLSILDLGGQLLAKDASSREWAVQGDHRARGYEKAHLGRLDLGGGQLVVHDIVAKATVTRTAHGVVKSAKGTRLGTVTANGETQTFPKTGVLEIPGVATLERAVVNRTHSGISVIGLRITLLDGSGAVINLAEAKLHIRPLH